MANLVNQVHFIHLVQGRLNGRNPARSRVLPRQRINRLGSEPMLRRDPVRVSTLRPVKRPRVLQLPLLGLGPFGLHPRALQEEGFEVRSLAVDVVVAIPGNSSTQWLTLFVHPLQELGFRISKTVEVPFSSRWRIGQCLPSCWMSSCLSLGP